jgi:hypothetical protein
MLQETTFARNRVTLTAGSRPSARASAAGRRAVRRWSDRSPDLCAPARGPGNPHVPGIPRCENPCPAASAPSGRRCGGWQSCRAALPILRMSPMSGSLVPDDVRTISQLASVSAHWRSAARLARLSHETWRAFARLAAGTLRFAGGAAHGLRRGHPQRAWRAPAARAVPTRVSGYRCEAAPSRPRSPRGERLARTWKLKLRQARALPGSAPSAAPEPTARSAPPG